RLTPALVRVSTTHPSSTSVRPFFLHDPAPTETYTLSLHDALPICSTAHTGPYSRRPNPAEIRQLTRQRIPAHPGARPPQLTACRSEEHTSELQSPCNLVCRLLLEKKKKNNTADSMSISSLITCLLI